MPEHLDLSNADQVREMLLGAINSGASVLIADMSRTRTCDYVGAEALARAHKRAVAAGTEMLIVAGSALTQRTLNVNGLDRLVPVYPSLEAARASGRRDPAADSAPAEPSSAAAASPQVRGDPPRPEVGVEVAILDLDGVIIWVNRAWEAFAARNGGDPARTGVGVSYLEACASVHGDQAADQAAAAIAQALAGDLPGPVTVEVPCHSPVTLRWYDMLIAPKRDAHGQPGGATVTLSLARSQPIAEHDQAPADMAAPPRPRQAPVSERDWIALADQVATQLFQVGLSLQAAEGKPPEIAGPFITQALGQTDKALRNLRDTTFRITSRGGQLATADAGNGSELEPETTADDDGRSSPDS